MKTFTKVAVIFLLPVIFACGTRAGDVQRIKAPDTVQGNLSGLVKSIKFSQEENGEKILKTEQTFNKTGDWQEIRQYKDGHLLFLTRYHYNLISGALVSYERLDGQGNAILTAACSFDPALKKMICAFTSANDKPGGGEEVSYNEKGLEIGSRQTDTEGSFVNSSVVQRDASGRPSHIDFSVPDHDNYMQFDYQWDPKGYESVKLENTEGHKIRRDFSEIKTDASGNWIERTVKSTGDDGDIKITKETRVIEYFEK